MTLRCGKLPAVAPELAPPLRHPTGSNRMNERNISLKAKYIQFTIIHDKENKQILTFEKLFGFFA